MQPLKDLSFEPAALDDSPLVPAPQADHGTGRRPGWLARKLIRQLMRPVQISLVEQLPGAFVMVELGGSSLAGLTWQPGQRLGLILNQELLSRTYTPMTWNARTGSVRLLLFRHGQGLASDWAGRVKAGDTCAIAGPVHSIDIPDASVPTAFFGDETSIATAVSIAQAGGRPARMRCLFEAGDARAAREVLRELGLGQAIVIERRPGDRHLEELRDEIEGRPGTQHALILTGKAASIRRLRRGLHRNRTGRIINRVYWAPGKSGLT